MLVDFVGLSRRSASFAFRKPWDALLLIRMALWIAVLSLLLRFLPLPRVLKIVSPRPRADGVQNPALSQERLAQLIDLLLGLNLFVFTPTCWKRAAVLHRYLALNRTRTQIVFGVRKENEGLLEGHAWLEAGQQPILEKSPPEYRVTYSLPLQNPVQN